MKLAIAFVLLMAAQAEENGMIRKMSDNQFAPVPGMPSCTTAAVETGDPSKGPAVLLAKATSGCLIPWHWHTPAETLMIVSGSAKMQMKDGKTDVLGAGSYALLPSKHVHQFTCMSTCVFFVMSDAAFDIHYVDGKGDEISADKALMTKRK